VRCSSLLCLRIPLLYGVLLFQHRNIYENKRALDHEIEIGSPHIRHLSFLTLAFKPEFFYWELVECLRRLVLGVAVGLVGYGTNFVAVFGFVLSLAFVYLHVEFKPYMEDSDNELGIALAYGQTLMFLIGLLIRSNSFGELALSLSGMCLVGLFCLGPIIIFLQFYRQQLNLLQSSCRSKIIQICGRLLARKQKDSLEEDEKVNESADEGMARESKFKSKLKAQKLMEGEGAKKHRRKGSKKQERKRKKKKEKEKKKANKQDQTTQEDLPPEIDDNLSSEIQYSSGEEDRYPLVEGMMDPKARALVLSLEHPQRRSLEQRETQFGGRIANRLASVDRPPSGHGLSRERENMDNELTSLVLNLAETAAKQDLPPENVQFLAIGDFVKWRSSDKYLPAGTVGQVTALFPEGDAEVLFNPRGSEPVGYTFAPDRLLKLHGAALQAHWDHEKTLSEEARHQAEVQKKLSAKYGVQIPASILSFAKRPPKHELAEMHEAHVKELAFQAQKEKFLAQFLVACGCGPETGALACLEELGVDCLADLQDPDIGAQEELAQLPAIGPKKAAEIVELAVEGSRL
jgi:hypothetical protein